MGRLGRDRASESSHSDNASSAVVLPGNPADLDEEFTGFVRRSSAELGRVAWYLCGDPVRAEDLLQHAYLRAYLAWPRIRSGDPIAYTRRVLSNSRIDRWRKERREHLTEPSAMPELAADDGAAARAEQDRLGRALQMLPTKQRRIVVLRHLMGLSEAETATELGVSLGTVKSTASRGLARLRDLVQERSDSPNTNRVGVHHD